MRIYSLIFVLTLFGCSSNYHYQKALKKGLKPLISSDTIRIATIDSVPIVIHDTIVYERYFSSKDTVIHYENIFVPKTRLETRIEYKIHRDTIRLETRVEVQKAKAEVKANKRPNWWLMLICVCVFIGVVYIAGRLINKVL